VDGERGQDGLLPPLDLVGDLGPGADQGHVFDQLGGDGRDGALLVTGQVEVLDRPGLRLVAHPGEDLVVIVEAARAHPADIKSQSRPNEIGRSFGIIIDDDGQRATHHVKGVAGVPGAGSGETLGQGGGVEVVHRGREEDRVPAVGDFGRQRHVPRSFGAEVDGNLGPVRMQDGAQRLA
jgi:hypothetical protein